MGDSGPIFPEYFPLHLKVSDAPPQRRGVNIWRGAWKPPPHTADEEQEEEEEAEIPEVPEVDEEALHQEAERARLASLKLATSENVVDYVDRQVRKEMIDAVRQGDVQLLSNFLDRFGRCVTERPDSMANFQSEAAGETVLHLALLMNYDTKEPVPSTEPASQKTQSEASEAERGSKGPKGSTAEATRTSGIGGAFRGLRDLRQIKSALSSESSTSIDLKC